MSGLAMLTNQVMPPSFKKGKRTITPTEMPTRNKRIIDRWIADARRRYKELTRAVRRTVWINDAFGLITNSAQTNAVEAAGRGAFSVGQDPTRIRNFMRWLRAQERQGVIEILQVPGRRRNTPWTDTYIRQNFQRGGVIGNADLLGLGMDIQRLAGSAEQTAAFVSQPQSVARIRLLQTRTWSGMIGITQQMNMQIAQELALGFLEGDSPRQMSFRINSRINAIGLERAELIARTESNRAYNQGALMEYELAENITGERILTQWHATLDSRVRASHLRRHGKVFTRADAQTLIGEPNCRCSLLPYVESIEGETTISKASSFLTNVEETQYWSANHEAFNSCGCAAA